MDNGGVTKEELSLLLSHNSKNLRESFTSVEPNTSTFIPGPSGIDEEKSGFLFHGRARASLYP